jgi:hypothetical protein
MVSYYFIWFGLILITKWEQVIKISIKYHKTKRVENYKHNIVAIQFCIIKKVVICDLGAKGGNGL